jgi:LuxR family maltose regulon positive regulatory protein
MVPAPLAARWGLLPSRFSPPIARTSDVSRDDLVSTLVASTVPIVSVIAPAGYGKSTLMAQFIDRDPRPAAWLSIDPGADDPVTLARSLVFALDPVRPIAEDLVRELDGLEPRMGRVTAALAAAVSDRETPFVLVVDDVHLVQERRGLTVLRSLAREVPAGSLVAFVGRNGSSLPLGRARAAGELLELGIDDLRFDRDEAAALLRGSGAGDLDADDVARLTDQTEGWAVGLYLAGRSFATTPDVEAPSFAGDDRFVADYLRETMLDGLAEDELDFLMKGSVLDELSGPLCDAALETTGSGAMLEALEASNLLIVPLDRRRDRYRYHHLFRDLLRSELEHRSPELVAGITARASVWCEQQGATDQAVAYAIAGRHVDRVAELLARYGQSTYYGGRASVARSWFAWFRGHAEMSRFPVIGVLGAWLHTAEGHAIEAERWIEDVRLAADTASGDDIEGIRLLLAAAMGRDGPEQMLADAERAAAMLHPASTWRPNSLLLGGLAQLCLGDLDGSMASFGGAADLSEAMEVPIACAIAHSELAIVAFQRGDLEASAASEAISRRIVDDGKLQGYPTSALTYAIGARIALAQGDPVRARSRVRDTEALELGLSYAIPTIGLQTDILVARCAMGLGDVGSAARYLAHADEVVEHRPHLGTLVTELEAARDDLEALRSSTTGAPSLTPAESRLLPLLTTHMSFREVGAELFISPHTVKTQAISIYRKLGVSSRGEAVRVAREIGLLAP